MIIPYKSFSFPSTSTSLLPTSKIFAYLFVFCHIFLPHRVFAAGENPILQEKYDFYDGEDLVFKLIEDKEVDSAIKYYNQFKFSKLSRIKEENSLFFRAIKAEYEKDFPTAIAYYLKSLKIKSQALVLNSFLNLWLNSHNIDFKNDPQSAANQLCSVEGWPFLYPLPKGSENSYVTLSKICLLQGHKIVFFDLNQKIYEQNLLELNQKKNQFSNSNANLKSDSDSSLNLTQNVTLKNDSGQIQSLNFELFLINTEFLLSRNLYEEAFQRSKKVLLIKSELNLFQKMQLIEKFKDHIHNLTQDKSQSDNPTREELKNDELKKDIVTLLQILKASYQDSEELKLALAQGYLVLEYFYNSSLFIEEIKVSNSLVNSILSELLTQTQRTQMASYYRSRIPENKEYLKNQLVYLIQNEKWIEVLSHSENLKKTPLDNKEIDYAMEFSKDLLIPTKKSN